MSDYLNHLIARTLNLAPVVQPRLPSWFEPPVPRRGVRLSPVPESAREHVPTEQPSPQASPLDPSVPQIVEARPLVTSGIDDQEANRRSSVPIADFNVPVHRRGEEQPVDQPATVPETIIVGSQSEPKPIGARTTTKARTDLQGPQLKPRVLRIGEEQTAPIRDLPADDRERADQSAAPSTRASGPPVAVDQANKRAIIPARQITTRRAVVTEEPQAITVTIGRVDVRAIFTQTPAPPISRVPKSTPMSLDEYLRQQSEGQR